MASITVPFKAEEHPHMRPLNVLRDLSTVADLIELCFGSTIDSDGQRYLSDMRRASRDDSFLNWATRAADSTSLPLTGYIWEQDGRIVGNISLIPFRDKGKRVFLVANVAVHPDHRGRGIAQALTQRAMKHAQQKKASAVWLHVRDDNPSAIHLYTKLGFEEIARRTTWYAMPDSTLPKPSTDIQIVPRQPRHWSLQREWLRRVYPETLNWYHTWNFNALRPGLWNWMYLLFVDFRIKQWAAIRDDELLATLTWIPQGGRPAAMFAAARAEADPQAVTQLLIHARSVLSRRSPLPLEYPAGEMTEAISAAGFKPRRTLIWMRA